MKKFIIIACMVAAVAGFALSAAVSSCGVDESSPSYKQGYNYGYSLLIQTQADEDAAPVLCQLDMHPPRDATGRSDYANWDEDAAVAGCKAGVKARAKAGN